MHACGNMNKNNRKNVSLPKCSSSDGLYHGKYKSFILKHGYINSSNIYQYAYEMLELKNPGKHTSR